MIVRIMAASPMTPTIIYGHLKQTAYVYLACIAVADAVFLAYHRVSRPENCESCEFNMTSMIIIKRFTW